MYRFGLGKNGRAKRFEADFVGTNVVWCCVCLSRLRGNTLPCVVPLHALISYSN
jgi:hypothetical protein